MAFAAMYVPDFMVQAVVRADFYVESRAESRAKSLAHGGGHERAIALIDGNPPLWNVVGATARALQAGIFLGMTKANAAQFSGVEIRMRSPAAETTAHAALRDAAWSISPRLEETAVDLLVLDISGLSALLGSEQKIAELLTARAAECGLHVQVAIVENPLAAEVAARGYAGITLVAADQKAKIIGNLPVSVLSPSEEIAATLDLWGIKTCAALARLPVLQLSERLGQAGVRLRALAQGTASRALIIAEAGLDFVEEMELDDAVEELEPLSFVLGRLLDQLCARLTARSLAASLLRIRFDLQPAFENAVDVQTEVVRAKSAPGIYERTMQLPVPMRDAKLLLKLLRLRLQGSPPGAPIVKVLLAAEAANPRVTQRGFFLPIFPDAEKLELTLSRLANVVGESNVGAAEVVDSHRPGEFRVERFAPPREELDRFARKTNRKNRAADKVEKHLPEHAVAMSFRVFRPPLPINVNSRAGRPAEVFLQGRRAEVCKASGPWRTSGEWWREEQWVEDEWDLEVRFVEAVRTQTPKRKPQNLAAYQGARHANAPTEKRTPEIGRYRIYFDAVRRGWFARGIYD